MGTLRGNWGDLPIEILDEMLTKFGDVEDMIRFGAVCSSWRCASMESKKNNCGPWMLLSEPESPYNFLDEETVMLINMFKDDEEKEEEEESSKDIKQDVRRFFNVSSKKTIELYLPEAKGSRCFGSTLGWILTVGLDLTIHLLNPLTHLQISLPPQATFPNQYHGIEGDEDNPPYDEELYGEPETHFLRRTTVEKFALSSHPQHYQHQQECVVVIIYSHERNLAVTRLGDSAWIEVKSPLRWFDDVIFFNNNFYAVHNGGDVVVCDITSPVPIARDFMRPPVRLRNYYRHYLVEMSGHLHMVLRVYKNVDDHVFTVNFRVYKLDFGQKKWMQMKSLGRNSLFLGNNGSFAIKHPQLRSNCIYFTDDHIEYYQDGNCDIGVFHFGKKEIIKPFYTGDLVRSTFCTPLFFIPNLH